MAITIPYCEAKPAPGRKWVLVNMWHKNRKNRQRTAGFTNSDHCHWAQAISYTYGLWKRLHETHTHTRVQYFHRKHL
jgi:hypothetical protein